MPRVPCAVPQVYKAPERCLYFATMQYLTFVFFVSLAVCFPILPLLNLTSLYASPVVGLDNETASAEFTPAGPDGLVLFRSSVSQHIQVQYLGIFGSVCQNVANRFYKFGQCLTETGFYKELDDEFWYKAASKALCGYTETIKDCVNGTNLTEAETPSSSGVQRKSLEAGSSGSCPRIKFPPMLHFPGLNFNATDDESLAVQALYLYMLNKINQGEELNATDFQILKERGIVDYLGVTTFTTSACLAACDLLRAFSNQLDACWQISSLTVAYGVCAVGCYAYFV